MNSLLQEHRSMSPKPADTVSTGTLLTVDHRLHLVRKLACVMTSLALISAAMLCAGGSAQASSTAVATAVATAITSALANALATVSG